ncbi:MAG: NTP transferase domain-containing protein [Patescibacteria group bacterium]|jgi:bifunctional UDP-N-acetylglucosamine pyrophosphorylase/glucosamine-1-phosphate N-acetyltransferase
MNDTKVVILAAGKGKRMGASVPKPLVPVAGKPMISHLLDRIRKSGLDEKPVVIVSPDGKDTFFAELGDSVTYGVQLEQNGTGDALRYAEDACKGASRIIVLYGDHPFIGPEVLKQLADLSSKNSGDIAMLTATVPNFVGDYSMFIKWGKIIRASSAKGHDGVMPVQALRESKDASAEEAMITEVNPGIYAFPVPWVFDRLKDVKNENASGEYYLTDLIGLAMAEGRKIVTASVDPLQVVGINTPDELSKAEELLNKRL